MQTVEKLTDRYLRARVDQPPARGQTVHDHANAIRQAITQEPQP